jgi:hypothetical protein
MTYPRIREQIDKFNGTVLKPYWLDGRNNALGKLQNSSLLGENDLWTDVSIKLYLMCWKMTMEAVRKLEIVSGYQWWLIVDYWGGSNGILDSWWTPKLPPEGMAQIQSINNEVQLLIAEPGADFLPLPANSSRFKLAYTSNATLETTLHVSNFGALAIRGSTVTWQVTATSGDSSKVLCKQSHAVAAVAQGPNTTLISKIACQLPDLGTFADNPQLPVTVWLNASLVSGAGATISSNWW